MQAQNEPSVKNNKRNWRVNEWGRSEHSWPLNNTGPLICGFLFNKYTVDTSHLWFCIMDSTKWVGNPQMWRAVHMHRSTPYYESWTFLHFGTYRVPGTNLSQIPENNWSVWGSKNYTWIFYCARLPCLILPLCKGIHLCGIYIHANFILQWNFSRIEHK